MSDNILLKLNPKIEFQFHDSGFNLLDKQTESNSGYYAYGDLQSIEVNHVWFPKMCNYLRVFTAIINGVPYFPDAETWKKAKIVFQFRKTKLGIWLTDTEMADNAKSLEKLLAKKIAFN